MTSTIPIKVTAGRKQTGASKIDRNRVTFDSSRPLLRKPEWIRVKIPAGNPVSKLQSQLRANRLVTVCEEASCPNIQECFGHGTATFMILGEVCTRRCAFCDVAHGRPLPPDDEEPLRLGQTVADMGLRYVVITSVDRDDLRDGGARHFVRSIDAVRAQSPGIQVEILTPDFRGRGRRERALAILAESPPDVFNHNLETVRELYPGVRPGADYQWSLDLLREFAQEHPTVPTKSGLMVGLGESMDQLLVAMGDLREHGVSLLTVGQYLQPSVHHHPVIRYWTPGEFEAVRKAGEGMGFSHVASGPLVRSSYHADRQAKAAAEAR